MSLVTCNIQKITGFKLNTIRDRISTKKAQGPHEEKKMFPRATKRVKSALILHKTAIWISFKNVWWSRGPHNHIRRATWSLLAAYLRPLQLILIFGLADISGSVAKIFRSNVMIKQEKVIPLRSTVSFRLGCPEEPTQGIFGWFIGFHLRKHKVSQEFLVTTKTIKKWTKNMSKIKSIFAIFFVSTW